VFPTQPGCLFDRRNSSYDGTAPGDGWLVSSGTSGATAYAAGVAALAVEQGIGQGRALGTEDLVSACLPVTQGRSHDRGRLRWSVPEPRGGPGAPHRLSRLRATLARQPRFAGHVFTPAERAYCEIPDDSAERCAVRFAAKEAALKALGVGLTGSVLTEIEVLHTPSGSPALQLTGRAAALAEKAGVRSWLVTLTHSRSLAHAFVAGPPGQSLSSGSGRITIRSRATFRVLLSVV
jgi:holo-[acyl-carrier protein] synthase